MLRYPGGTPLDETTTRYSPLRNFLSDLGMTVSYSGQPNRLGALLFVAGLLCLIAGAALLLLEFIRLCSTPARARRFARAAGAIALASCLAFVGVAFTPENRVMSLHVDFTLWASYVGVLEWGPPVVTPRGLLVQVVAQKAVVCSALVTFIGLSLEASRVPGNPY